MSSPMTRRSLLVAGAGAGLALTLRVPTASATDLTYRYQQQQRYNWCSAGSARIAISAPKLRWADSSENPNIPTQDSLARGLDLDPYDGDAPTTGLKDPGLIAAVMNNRLGLAGDPNRYRLRYSPAGTLYEDLQAKVRSSINAGFPVVINMNRVDNDTFDGHYIVIVGFGPERYMIADPYTANRNGVWRLKQDIVDWNKLNRFTYYG